MYLFHLSFVIGSIQATVLAATYCEPANSTKSPEVDLDIYQDKANDLSLSDWLRPRRSQYPFKCGDCQTISLRSNSSSSRWTVEVQRLLQPTRELVKSGYETGVESQGAVITR